MGMKKKERRKLKQAQMLSCELVEITDDLIKELRNKKNGMPEDYLKQMQFAGYRYCRNCNSFYKLLE